ncbi:MAG: hypothetical protein ACPGJV_08260 [Bacteriovoracaceae bacterium]
MQDKMTYFQFNAVEELPVFVRVDLGQFHNELEDFLKVHNFVKLDKDQTKKIEKKLETRLTGRVLTLKPAAPSVTRQIEGVLEADQFGEESIIPKTGYRVYRYKNAGLLVYSFAATEWELGCFENFGSQEAKFESTVIINRYISWSLASHGIVGFWGDYEDNHMVVMRKDAAEGHAVYLDFNHSQIIMAGGAHKLGAKFRIVSFNSTAKRATKMNPESMLSFLSSRCSFLDVQGLSVPVRQLIQNIIKSYPAYECSADSVKTELSEAL